MQVSIEAVNELGAVLARFEQMNGTVRIEAMSRDCECTGTCGHSCSTTCEGGCENTCYTTCSGSGN